MHKLGWANMHTCPNQAILYKYTPNTRICIRSVVVKVVVYAFFFFFSVPCVGWVNYCSIGHSDFGSPLLIFAGFLVDSAHHHNR